MVLNYGRVCKHVLQEVQKIYEEWVAIMTVEVPATPSSKQEGKQNVYHSNPYTKLYSETQLLPRNY